MEAGITVLETQVVVLKIGMISVEKACFEAEMRVVTTWQEPKLEIEKSVVHPITLNSGYWMPLLGVQNVIGNLETLSRRIGIDPVRKSFLVQEVILWGEFSFEPDNFYFPLDIQTLKLMLYCENSEKRKVLIVNSLNLLHYIRHDFHCLSADFAIHDVIDSATLSDQNYHKKYFSILRITFYISRVLRDRNSRWLTFPFLVAMTTMFILSVDNMNPSDQMITLVAVHVFLSIARKFLTWSVAFSVVELYWWCLSILSTLSLLWCGLQFYDFFPFGKVILLFLYPFVVAFFSCWFYLEPFKRKENLINNSLIYKATMLNLQGDHELVLPSKRRTVRYNYPQTILDHQPGEAF